MTDTIYPCDDRQLKKLLRSDAPSSSDQSLIEHLDDCPHCQSRLWELAASDEDWKQAATVLADRDHAADRQDNLTPGAARRTEGPLAWTEGPLAWTESMAKNLLFPPSHPEMLGRIGRYDVERLIGSGGMGVVFKAHDTELNRPVAIKLLAPFLASSGTARNRFAREARAAAGVVDDHVVPIFNVESEGEPPFLVMQFVAGGSLQERLDRDGPLQVAEVVRIGMQVARGLAAAHAQGLIHRDVKPSNILLDEGVERAMLTDFGLARTESDACLTRSGFHPGTPHYMSPEQVRGETLDARSDLFGLGCVLYAACVGHSPFRADTSYAVMRRITDESPRPIRELNAGIPQWLETIVMKLLSKSRDDRPASAEVVAELLEGCLAHVQEPSTTPLPAPVAGFEKSLGTRYRNARQAESPGRFRYPPIRKLIAVAAFAVPLLIAGFFITLETGKGTITIESEVDDVRIVIKKEGRVHDKLTVNRDGASIRLYAGEYEVALDGEFDRMIIDKKTIQLGRLEETIVKIRSDSKPVDDRAGDPGSEISLMDSPANTQVHVVGCYEPHDHQPVHVRVESTGYPMIVVLNAYFATGWNLQLADDADVRGVIVSGYFDQRFTHTWPKNIPTIYRTYFPTWPGMTGEERRHRAEQCFYVWSPLLEDFDKMDRLVLGATDRKLTTFQGVYAARNFVIDGKRGRAELDVARQWQALKERSDRGSLAFLQEKAQLEHLIHADAEQGLSDDVILKINRRLHEYEETLKSGQLGDDRVGGSDSAVKATREASTHLSDHRTFPKGQEQATPAIEMRNRIQGTWDVLVFDTGDGQGHSKQSYQIAIRQNVLHVLTVVNGKASGAAPYKLVWPDSKTAEEVDCVWDPNNNTIPHPSRIACDGETLQLAMRVGEVDDRYDRPSVVASGDGIWYVDCKRAEPPFEPIGIDNVSHADSAKTTSQTDVDDTQTPRYKGHDIQWWLDERRDTAGDPGQLERANVALVAIDKLGRMPACDKAITDAMRTWRESLVHELSTEEHFSIAAQIIAISRERHQRAALENVYRISLRIAELTSENNVTKTDLSEMWTRFQEMLAEIDLEKSGVPTGIIQDIRDGDSGTRRIAMRLLLATGANLEESDSTKESRGSGEIVPVEDRDALVDAVLAASNDANAEVRFLSLVFVGFMVQQDARCAERMREALESGSPEEQSIALDYFEEYAESLGVGEDLVSSTLIRWANSGDPEQIYYAILYLGQRHDRVTRPQSLDELVQLLEDPDWALNQVYPFPDKGRVRTGPLRAFAIQSLGEYWHRGMKGLAVLESEIARGRSETIQEALTARASIAGYSADLPVKELQGRWLLEEIEEAPNAGDLLSLQSHRTKDGDLILLIDGTEMRLKNELLAHLSHQREHPDGKGICLQLDPDRRKQHCHGTFRMEDNKLSLSVFTAWYEDDHKGATTHRYRFVRQGDSRQTTILKRHQ